MKFLLLGRSYKSLESQNVVTRGESGVAVALSRGVAMVTLKIPHAVDVYYNCSAKLSILNSILAVFTFAPVVQNCQPLKTKIEIRSAVLAVLHFCIIDE